MIDASRASFFSQAATLASKSMAVDVGSGHLPICCRSGRVLAAGLCVVCAVIVVVVVAAAAAVDDGGEGGRSGEGTERGSK
jgi:hypothetical protein